MDPAHLPNPPVPPLHKWRGGNPSTKARKEANGRLRPGPLSIHGEGLGAPCVQSGGEVGEHPALCTLHSEPIRTQGRIIIRPYGIFVLCALNSEWPPALSVTSAAADDRRNRLFRCGARRIPSLALIPHPIDFAGCLAFKRTCYMQPPRLARKTFFQSSGGERSFAPTGQAQGPGPTATHGRIATSLHLPSELCTLHSEPIQAQGRMIIRPQGIFELCTLNFELCTLNSFSAFSLTGGEPVR